MERAARAAGWVALAVVAVAVRARGVHSGLIYPDGYQYLLMAKGISVHLTPTLRLGQGGSMFIPSVDAALKPLFPALVAIASILEPARAAANAVTVLAGAATVVLAGFVATRLSGSRVGGALAAVVVLFSPALAYWSGFAGPDPLAQALALGTALALANRRAAVAGVLGALCIAARPEWLLVFVPIAIALVARTESRGAAGRALRWGAFTLAALIGVLRPPLGMPAGGLAILLLALAGAASLQLALAWVAARDDRSAWVVLATAAAIAGLVLSGRVPALAALGRQAWPVCLLAAAGLWQACRSGRARPALVLLGAGITLCATYAFRNPDSGRYATQLVPLLAVSAGLTMTAAPGPRPVAVRALTAAAAVVAAALLWAPPAPLATDTFASLAGRLAGMPPGTLVSAAPDAYGFLLPGRAQQPLRLGARGLILLDAAQRSYDPGLSAHGVVVARLTPPNGFERPNGTLDMGPALLVRGVAVARR